MKKLKLIQMIKEGGEFIIQGVYRNVGRSTLSDEPEYTVGLLDKGNSYFFMLEEGKKLAFHNNVTFCDLASETVAEVIAKMEKRL